MPRRTKDIIEKEVREKVFETASSILSKYDPAQLTMDMLARQADLAKGTLYNYFKDKADLLAFLSVRSLEPYLDQADEIVSARISVVEKFRKYIELNIRMSHERRKMVTILSKSMPLSIWQSRKDVREADRRATEQLQKIVDEGIREGIFMDLAGKDIVLFFRGIVTFFSRQWLVLDEGNFVAADPDKIMEIFMHGISSQSKHMDANPKAS